MKVHDLKINIEIYILYRSSIYLSGITDSLWIVIVGLRIGWDADSRLRVTNVAHPFDLEDKQYTSFASNLSPLKELPIDSDFFW